MRLVGREYPSWEISPTPRSQLLKFQSWGLAIALITMSLGMRAKADSSNSWPNHWWAPVPKEGAPSWEILPQEAEPGEVILSKRNELGILSNFAATPIQLHGEKFASVEGFWQSLLYPENKEDPRATFPGLHWKFTRAEVAAMTAFEAKSAGDLAFQNMKKMQINWVSFQGKKMDYWVTEKGAHYHLIREAMETKLKQNPQVKRILLATKGLILKPDHYEEKNAPPAWHYYQIWMELRETLKN